MPDERLRSLGERYTGLKVSSITAEPGSPDAGSCRLNHF
jgi:hypothetical protein